MKKHGDVLYKSAWNGRRCDLVPLRWGWAQHPKLAVDNQLECLVDKYASVLLRLRASGVVRSVEVRMGCLFVHAETASEALRTRLLGDIQREERSDLRIAVTVNLALPIAEVNGRLATGVGTVGTVGGALGIVFE
jgi:hypothetical protein